MYAALECKRTMTCFSVRSSIVQVHSLVILYDFFFFFKCIFVDVCLRNVNQYYRKKIHTNLYT